MPNYLHACVYMHELYVCFALYISRFVVGTPSHAVNHSIGEFSRPHKIRNLYSKKTLVIPSKIKYAGVNDTMHGILIMCTLY